MLYLGFPIDYCTQQKVVTYIRKVVIDIQLGRQHLVYQIETCSFETFMIQISLDYLFLLTLASIMLLQSQIDLTTDCFCEHFYVHLSLYFCFFFNAEEKLTNMFLLYFFSRLFLKITKSVKMYFFNQFSLFLIYVTVSDITSSISPPINS